LTQRLAANRVGRLHDEGIERPEAFLRQSKQGAAAEPPDGDDDYEEDRRPDASERGCELAREFAEPDRRYDRRDPQHQTRYDDEEGESHRQLRQADLCKQAAGERQQRAALGTGRVILDIAAARIHGRPQGAPPNLHRLRRIAR
jgi:hypothetical protein